MGRISGIRNTVGPELNSITCTSMISGSKGDTRKSANTQGELLRDNQHPDVVVCNLMSSTPGGLVKGSSGLVQAPRSWCTPPRPNGGGGQCLCHQSCLAHTDLGCRLSYHQPCLVHTDLGCMALETPLELPTCPPASSQADQPVLWMCRQASTLFRGLAPLHGALTACIALSF